MSSNKKTLGSAILLFIIFALVAGLGWFFLNGKTNSDSASKQDLANQIAQSIESGDDVNDESVNIDDINEARPANETNQDMVGVAGTKTTLDQPAIYGTRGLGDPNAPVKIQEFFSLTCNHCAEFHTGAYQDLKTEFIDTGKVYFVYEEFPLNGPALYGSMIARCLPEARYAKFIDVLLRQQDDWAFGGDFKSALKKNAKLMGMTDEEFDACYADKDLQKAIGENIKLASDAWKVNSTPSFVINDGERILYGGQNIETFRKLYTQLTGETASTPVTNSLNTLKAKTVTTIETLEETVGGPISNFNSTASDELDSTVIRTIEAASKKLEASSDTLDAAIDKANKAINDAANARLEATPALENEITE